MVLFTKDGWVWLEHPKESWIPVKMVSAKENKIMAKSSSGEQFVLDASATMAAVNTSSLTHVDNMVEMEELSEAAILHNLRLRYEENLIYTYISSILVSVNPFKMLPIYSPAVMKDYREKLTAHIKMPPHVYALAHNAYTNLTADGASQSVIISGESGAGKTEATKLVLQYMAEMSGQGSEVEQQLLEANPIVEAFGNAKTARNNNSSRFGKWIEIVFNGQYHICGARIYNYLLEKSRIVDQNPDERNYHVFYQICAGASAADQARWKISNPRNFRILSAGDCFEVNGVDDVSDYKEMRQAMNVLAFTSAEQEAIFQIVSGVMHLGNVEFNQSGEASSVKDMIAVTNAASLFECDAKTLTAALITQRKVMGRESILTAFNAVQAEANRDALCKAIYGGLFNWLIERINRTLATTVPARTVVGVLDIFGFEIFSTNRFEQFCINFANEKMQQHFNEHIFTMEQAEYKSDAIDVAHVSFVDNQECLDLIEKGKQSILAMCDEELKLPKGSDPNLLTRMHAQFKTHRYYQAPKVGAPNFSVLHYAGVVTYEIEGFMEKNKDALGEDAAAVIRASRNVLLNKLVAGVNTATVGTQFKSQLEQLMTTLKKTAPHFIRCIKPNAIKVSDTFDGLLALRQLRYLGLKEVVNIRQLGYPVRRTHKNFFDRYKALLHGYTPKADMKVNSMALINGISLPANEWRVGNTKVFIKNVAQSKLELLREKKVTALVIRVQARYRAKLVRLRFKKYKALEAALRTAIEGTNVSLLEKAIGDYESLKGLARKELVQQALVRRNELNAQATAVKALIAATSAKDVQLLATAVESAKRARLPATTPQYVTATTLLAKLEAYSKEMKEAMTIKTLSSLNAALSLARELGLNGPGEVAAIALVRELEEQERLKKALSDAMASRDLAAVKNALKVAMEAKSGMMVGNALARAKEAGMMDDPVLREMVNKAMALESTLEKEVTVTKMAAELQAAINSADVSILDSTIKLAQSKGFGKHALCVQASELMEKIKQRTIAFADLTNACKTQDLGELKRAIEAADRLNMKEIRESNEYIEANRARDTIMKAAAAAAAASAATAAATATSSSSSSSSGATLGSEFKDIQTRAPRESVAGTSTIQVALSAAVESGDIGMLRAAIERARDVHFPIANPQYMRAVQMMDELEEDLANMEREVVQSNVGSSVGIGAEVKSPATSAVTLAPEIVTFDKTKYGIDSFKFAKFSGLRSPSSFSAGSVLFKSKKEKSMLHWSKDVIPNSMTTLDDHRDNIAKAIELFKSIQGFMGDRHYSFPDSLVSELVQDIMIIKPLRTEVYVQVMKQVSHNPKPESLIRGWMLMALLAESCPPPSSFLFFVLNFVDAHIAAPDVSSDVKSYATYTLHALRRTCGRFKVMDPADEKRDEKTSSTPPSPFLSIDHVTAFRERTMEPALVTVHFPDATELMLMVVPWEFNEVLLPKLCEQIKLRDTEGVAIYEHRGSQLRYIFPDECLLDFQKQWAKAVVREEKKKAGGFASLFTRKKKEVKEEAPADGPGRFVFMRRIFGKPVGDSTDMIAKQLMVHQFARGIAAGDQSIPSDIAANLVGMAKILTDSKQLSPLARPPKTELRDSLFPGLWSFPPSFAEGSKKIKPADYEKLWKKSENDNKTSCSIDSYLAIARQQLTFGANFYRVGQDYDTEYPPELVIAINFYGLFLLDCRTKSEIIHFPFLSVLGWSASPVRVLIKVQLPSPKAGKSTATLRFTTNDPRLGREICDLFITYAAEMMKAVGIARRP